MDILKSSNVERVLFDLFGAKRTKELMLNLEKQNYYKLTQNELSKLKEIFLATFSSDDEVSEVIKKYSLENYIMDTHTATCLKAYKEFVYNKKVAVIHSTAEWTKFSVSIINSIKGEIKKISDKEALNEIKNRFNLPIPPQIEELFSATIKHSTVVEKDKITEEIIKFL